MMLIAGENIKSGDVVKIVDNVAYRADVTPIIDNIAIRYGWAKVPSRLPGAVVYYRERKEIVYWTSTRTMKIRNEENVEIKKLVTMEQMPGLFE